MSCFLKTDICATPFISQEKADLDKVLISHVAWCAVGKKKGAVISVPLALSAFLLCLHLMSVASSFLITVSGTPILPVGTCVLSDL